MSGFRLFQFWVAVGLNVLVVGGSLVTEASAQSVVCNPATQICL